MGLDVKNELVHHVVSWGFHEWVFTVSGTDFCLCIFRPYASKFDAFTQSIISEDKDTTFTFHALSSFHFHSTEYLTRITFFVHQCLIPLCCGAGELEIKLPLDDTTLFSTSSSKTWFNPSLHLNILSKIGILVNFEKYKRTNISILQFSEILQGHVPCHYQNVQFVAGFRNQVSTISMTWGERKVRSEWYWRF